MSIETIKINEVEYVRKESLTNQAPSLNGLKHAIVRTYSAGVFAGYIESQNGQELRQNVSSGIEIESISRSHGLSKFSDFYGEE